MNGIVQKTVYAMILARPTKRIFHAPFALKVIRTHLVESVRGLASIKITALQ